MRHLFLLFSLVLSVTVADDSAKDKSQNSSYITDSPITLAETTLATSLNSSGYDEDYYRKNSRPANAVKKSTTVKPVVRQPATTTRRPSRTTRRPAETKDPVHSWDQADTCGGNILVPLSDDQNNKVIEETYRSTSFPTARTYPLICTWNVKVSKNCRHGRIVLRLDERSRLPNDKECANGYIRVSPFMKEAKICGRIGDVPPLQWHVEDQQPETVTISMRNIGLEEDKSTGLSFTLQGECLAYLSNVTINDTGMNSSNSQWLHQLWKNSVVAGGPRVFIPGVELANIIPWMENPGTLPPPTTLASVTSVNNIESNLNQPPTRRPRPTRRPNTRRPSLPTAHPVTARATTPRPITFDQYDTCGGTIHVPLIFDRLSFHESSHFFTGRNYPLVCIWNVKVSPLCRRTRVTMRVDVRSRLADVDGCTKGYYTVSPIMKEAKLCGRIGTVPPFQWYVDDQKLEDVSIVMENIGLNDGRSEGLSFSLQSECIQIRPDIKKIDVDIENYWSTTRWVNRLREESVKGDGPRLITPGIFGSTTISSILPNTQNFNKTTSNHFEDQSDIPWLILKPLSDTKVSSSSNVVPNVVSNEIVAPAAIHSSTSPVNNLPKIPDVTPHVTSPIPWVILKSPVSENHSPLKASTTPSTSAKPLTTVRPPTTHRSSTSPSTNKPTSTTRRPFNKTGAVQSTTVTRLSSTTVRPSTAAKKPATKSAVPSSTRVSTVRPTSPTVRQQTKRQSTTTRKSGTKVPPTTKSPVLNVPNSNSKAATNGVRPIVINDDVIIDEAISDITSQLEEIKREAEINQQK
ncbi:hypothetical protein DAPPUDRAFT_224770 [Daphnia pulex]|uniref:CUB domain-containing protein n=1 Tax=Daphnia pulex TaxID=6669 RepID=E9GJG5_DAPPU|nr:hypothetical protein DAPPUDRAFT_224770 [Daphnia pulex]|eukprot:EFX80455.1 hypothetical protein DAPPUDRAFT_224770 [Daphnia pulex]